MSQETAVIVEDDKDMAEILKTILMEEGYEVSVFEDLDIVESFFSDYVHDINLAVVDCSFQDSKGIELIAKIRKKRPSIRIVAISGDKSNMKPSFKAGCNYFLTNQPFQTKIFRNAIKPKIVER